MWITNHHVKGQTTVFGIVQKRPEVHILADLRSFRLRKIILLQIKIRRSTAVGQNAFGVVGCRCVMQHLTLQSIFTYQILL